MSIHYEWINRSIQGRAKCSPDEAWTAMSIAFLSLDRSRTEREQVSYLLEYGTLNVKKQLQREYTPDGERKFQYGYDWDSVEEPSDHADDAFLDFFKEGTEREFALAIAEGEATFTHGSASHWLRKHKNINKRTACKQLLDSVRDSAILLLFRRRYEQGKV